MAGVDVLKNLTERIVSATINDTCSSTHITTMYSLSTSVTTLVSSISSQLSAMYSILATVYLKYYNHNFYLYCKYIYYDNHHNFIYRYNCHLQYSKFRPGYNHYLHLLNKEGHDIFCG